MNRSTLVRVPRYRPGHDLSTRVEYRSPDPACNPYLAFAVMLAAGLRGIDQKLELRESNEADIYEMDGEEREKLGISTLPGSLGEAVSEAEKSDLLRETLGDETFEKLLRNKRAIWDKYRAILTAYELEHDLPVL
jgi:glutamine synthetase